MPAAPLGAGWPPARGGPERWISSGGRASRKPRKSGGSLVGLCSSENGLKLGGCVAWESFKAWAPPGTWAADPRPSPQCPGHRASESWAPTAIREMLRNPIYRGERVWNRSEWVKDHETGSKCRDCIYDCLERGTWRAQVRAC